MGSTMKTIFAVLALLVSTAASAACYVIYSPTNEIVWRSLVPPVPMDTASIDAEVQKKVPKGHLVINTESEAFCTELDLTTPRKSMRDVAEEINKGPEKPLRRL
jgi:hypothetical protein